MKKIELIKIKTLDTAIHPQSDKYPDGYITKGFMWEHTVPKVGFEFYVMFNKLDALYRTSRVVEIVEDNDSGIIFNTLNSQYKIIYKD